MARPFDAGAALAGSGRHSAGLPTLAVRNPQGVFSEIIAQLDVPLAAPSANRSGSVSPTTAAAVAESLQDRVTLVLDGGPCSVGVESAIVKVEGDKVFLLRPGGLPRADIERVTGRKLQKPDAQAAVQAPGMLKSHYAPEAAVRLEVTELHRGEALLAFGAQRAKGYENAVALLNLSPAGNMEEAASNLFSYLHALDRPDIAAIAVEPIPYTGLGEAINDRLQRAAAPRAQNCPAG
ncbi:MAG: Sua5/YciO/YrdC/YwlC family protein [Candidatus Tokpelaia hoelldobleri]|uniref:L-threonylcarbamoyladenylate synthase n=1 Tax=Candidatus Tokpelaia hoelldobleri TaxID=1902579 RepID=A0A1U9JT99_9HYPH|nr:MAG: Sua5/YciO/YrdC/YwlC family protein [Candidatus Tokpelaia hoelldoblerii]